MVAKSIFTFGVVVGAAIVANGGITGASGTVYGDDFVYKSASDSGSNSGFFNTLWSDGKAPNPSKKYVVVNQCLRTPTDNPSGVYVFGDDGQDGYASLFVDVLDEADNFQNPTDGNKASVRYRDLHLVKGQLALWGAAAAWANCNVTIDAKPFYFYSRFSASTRWFRAGDSVFSGAEGTGLQFEARQQNSETSETLYYFDRCTFSDFKGKFIVGSRDPNPSCQVYFVPRYGLTGSLDVDVGQYGHVWPKSVNATFGTVDLKDGGVFTLSTDCTPNVSTLRMNGGALDLTKRLAGATSTVGLQVSSVERAEGEKIPVGGFGHAYGVDQPWCAVVKLPGDTTLTADDFTVRPDYFNLPSGSFKLESDVVSVRRRDIVQLLQGDSSVNGGSSFQEAKKANWTDGALPHADADYLVYGVQLMWHESVKVFPGSSLLVVNGGTLALTADSSAATISNLHVVAGSSIKSWGTTLDGSPIRLWAQPNKQVNVCLASRSAVINNELVGDADILIFPQEDKAQQHTLTLGCDDSSSFTGKMRMEFRGGVANRVPSVNKYQVLCIGSALALGGSRAEFAYDALTITEYQALRALKDGIVFDEPTRGVYFLGNARVQVPEKMTMTFAQPATWEGLLQKEGAGTLALGGSVRFTSAQLEDPTGLDGTNGLEIVEGCLKPVSKTAVDGLSVVFRRGTSLLLDVSPSVEELADVGLYDVKTANPVTFEDDMLAVAFVAAGWETAPEGKLVRGVMTVKDVATANALLPKLAVTTPWKSVNVDLSVRPNVEDGTATIVAKLYRRGCFLFFR